MRNRRKFLCSAGALAALGTVGKASASNQRKGLSTEAVHQKIHSGAQRDGVEGVKQALDTPRLDSVVQQSEDFELASQNEVKEVVGDESDVSADYAYEDPEDSDSEISVSVYTDMFTDDEVFVTASMNLRGCSRTFRNAWFIENAIGLIFIDQDWAPMGESRVSASQDHSARFTEENVADEARAATVDIDNHSSTGGATCGSLPDATVSLTSHFRLRSGGEPTTIWGSYSHTIAPDPWGAIQGIDGGSNGISVSTSYGATTYWSIGDPVDPEDVL